MNRAITHLPWLTGLAVVTTTGLWLVLGPAPPDLVYDRAAIAQGEGWRLVTGHLVHSDAEHALWDIAALALIGWILERRGRLRLALAAATGMAAVSLYLWIGLPGLVRYCGLSGLLNTLFVVALKDLWDRQPHPLIPLLALGLAGKLACELLAGQSLFIQTAWPSLPEAHLAGCLGGIAVLSLDGFCRHGHRRPQSGHSSSSIW
jgi:rhomboid family GlyGly-CTERM serine protease